MNNLDLVKTETTTAILNAQGVKVTVIDELVAQAQWDIAMVSDAAKQVVILTPESYSAAGELKKLIKATEKRIIDGFAPMLRLFDHAHAKANALKKELLEGVVLANITIEQKRIAWANEQERIRRDREIKAQEEAKKLEEERRLQEAERLEAAGEREEALRILDEPIEPAIIVMPSLVPKTEGISKRQVWKFRIIDESLIPREYLMPNEVKIGLLVRAMKEQTNIPGIEVFFTEIEPTRA